MRYCLLVLLFSSQFCFSQDARLFYSQQISEDTLKKTVFILASDSLEGRETGKKGQKRAALFLASIYNELQLTRMGVVGGSSDNRSLSGSFFQKHPITLKSNKSRNLSINGKNFLFGKDFYYDLPGADTILFFNSILFVGSGDCSQTDRISKRLKNNERPNVLFFEVNKDKTDCLLNELDKQKIRPAVVFIISPNENIQEDFMKDSGLIPRHNFLVLKVSKKVAEEFFQKGILAKLIEKSTRKNKRIFKSRECESSLALLDNTDELSGQNVIALIPGTDTLNETVVISSHYDHLGIRDSSIYFGADDNASGTSAVIEMARIFTEAKKNGHPPRRNILFLNVSGEEKGLLGSSWFVDHPPIPLKNMVANVNIDMIGRTDQHHDSIGETEYVYIIGADMTSSELKTINEEQNSIGPKLVLDYTYNTKDDPNRYYQRSDHYNFLKNQIPIIFYFNGAHVDYHQPTDTPDKINFSLLKKRTQLAFLTAWELANREKRPVIDKIDESGQ